VTTPHRSPARLTAATSLLVGILSIGAFVAPASAQVPTTTDATAGAAYVALGDSYAAGLGLEPLTDVAVTGCATSGLNYPHRIAEALDLDLTDVTCSSAETKNLIGTEQNPGGGTAAPQSDALGDNTRIVTITIGGNDLGFIGLASSCLALTRGGPILTTGAENCRDTYEAEGTTFDDKIANLVGTSATADSGLTATFAAVKEKAPNADVFVVGYPSIMPDAANTPEDGCYRADLKAESIASIRVENGFPFTDVDVAFIREVQEKLDAATATAAEAAGFTYVSTLAGSAAHSACQTDGTAYVNGLGFSSDEQHNITMPPGSLHPNEAGEAFMADATIPLIEKALQPAAEEPSESPVAGTSVVWIIAAGALVVLALIVVIALIARRRRKA